MSPLAATGVLQLGDWVRDDLPDYLWPVLTLSELGTASAQRFVSWQGAVLADLAGLADNEFLADCLDGRLTGLDRLAARVPQARSVIKERADEWGILPSGVARTLASYPFMPAEWLVDIENQPPRQPEIDRLARAVLEVLKDGHREAVVKCLFIWSRVQAHAFSSDQQTISLLKGYPNDASTRTQADTVVRASWGAHRAMLLNEEPDRFVDTIKWAKVFWGANSMTTGCLRKRDVEDEPDPSSTGDTISLAPVGEPGLASTDFRRRAWTSRRATSR
jgi:hypothetical protein